MGVVREADVAAAVVVDDHSGQVTLVVGDDHPPWTEVVGAGVAGVSEGEVVQSINSDAENALFLPGIKLNATVRATADLADADLRQVKGLESAKGLGLALNLDRALR